MRSPMTPVEQTRTWPGSVPSSPAAQAAVASVSRRPWIPVQALALPELRTTAQARPGSFPHDRPGAGVTRQRVRRRHGWW